MNFWRDYRFLKNLLLFLTKVLCSGSLVKANYLADDEDLTEFGSALMPNNIICDDNSEGSGQLCDVFLNGKRQTHVIKQYEIKILILAPANPTIDLPFTMQQAKELWHLTSDLTKNSRLCKLYNENFNIFQHTFRFDSVDRVQ